MSPFLINGAVRQIDRGAGGGLRQDVRHAQSARFEIGGDEGTRPRQIRAQPSGDRALPDPQIAVIELPHLALVREFAGGLELRQLRRRQAEPAQQLGGIAAGGLEVDVQALQKLRPIDAALRGHLGLSGLDFGIDVVGRALLLVGPGRPRPHVEHDRLVLEGAIAAQRQGWQAVRETGLQIDVLEVQLGSFELLDHVLDVDAQRRQLAEVEPALACVGLPMRRARCAGGSQLREIGGFEPIRVQRRADPGHLLAELEREIARQIALAEPQAQRHRIRPGGGVELRGRRSAELEVERLARHGAGGGQRHLAVRAAGAAGHLGETGRDPAPAAVREVVDRRVRDLQPADLGDVRRERKLSRESPVRRTVGSGLQSQARPGDRSPPAGGSRP